MRNFSVVEHILTLCVSRPHKGYELKPRMPYRRLFPGSLCCECCRPEWKKSCTDNASTPLPVLTASTITNWTLECHIEDFTPQDLCREGCQWREALPEVPSEHGWLQITAWLVRKPAESITWRHEELTIGGYTGSRPTPRSRDLHRVTV